jgi:hypothetical protein
MEPVIGVIVAVVIISLGCIALNRKAQKSFEESIEQLTENLPEQFSVQVVPEEPVVAETVVAETVVAESVTEVTKEPAPVKKTRKPRKPKAEVVSITKKATVKKSKKA